MTRIAPRIVIGMLMLLVHTTTALSQSEWEDDLLEQLLNVEMDLSAEQIAVLADNPIHLNRADSNGLTAFPFITPHLARRIVTERKNRGDFLSFSDFIIRMRLDDRSWNRFRSFFRTDRKRKRISPLLRVRNRIVYHTPRSKGLLNGDYPGAPFKSYARIRIHPVESLEIGMLTEKDSGEPQWADHLVGYIQLSWLDDRLRLLCGNYIVESGQGLVLWGPYRFAGGSDPVAPHKIGIRGPVGYVYSDENRALQGLACEYRSDKWTGRFYVSDRQLDASLTLNGKINTFGTSGLHRTDSEADRKNAAGEQLTGVEISRTVSNGTIGITAIQNRFSASIVGDSEFPFELDGDKNAVAGLYYTLSFGDWNLNGEFAMSQSGGIAAITSLRCDIKQFSAVFSLRQFDPDFHNPHANGLARFEARNEQGGTIGLVLKKVVMDRISMRFDLFRRPWNSFAMAIPYYGSETFFQMEKTVTRGQKLRVRYRLRREEDCFVFIVNERDDRTIGQPIHHQIRLDLQSRISKHWSIRNRAEWARYQEPNPRTGTTRRESGFLLFSEIRFQPLSSFRISGRYTAFQSDSYNSRLYAYESGVPGYYTIPVLYGQGSRHYILVDYQTQKWCRLGFKYSETFHDRETEWGSGLDATAGDTRRTFTFQIDIKI